MTVALTIGSFDPVHVDHVLLFRRCEELADKVVVGVNSDDFYITYRNQKPMFDQQARMDMVAALGYEVWTNDGAGRELIERILPHFLVVGSDWLGRDYLAQVNIDEKFMQKHDVTVVFVPRGTHVSSGEIRAGR